jgi:molybdopterin-binding protein
MSTLKVTNVKHETSGLNTLVFDNGGNSGGNGRVTTKGTIGEVITATYASTITLDFKTGNNFTTTLTGNTTFANPTTLVAGQSGVIFIIQDGTGGHTAAFESYWDFSDGTAPTLSTGANAVDMIAWIARSSTKISAQFVGNFS